MEKKKSTKKRKKKWKWAAPINFLIRFSQAYMSKHNHKENNYI